MKKKHQVKIDIDLHDVDVTVASICDMALNIGEGAKPGTMAAITAILLRDTATPWANLLNQSIKGHYHPGEVTIGVLRAYATLIALTLISSAKSGRELEGANHAMRIMSGDVVSMVKNMLDEVSRR